MRHLTKAILVVLVLAVAAPVLAADGGAPAPTAAAAPAATAAPVAPTAAPTAPATQPAAEVKAEPRPEQQVFWQVLLAELLKVFLVIAVPVLSTFLASLLKRWKINVEYQQIASIAEKAAGWAEHKALAALKEGKPKSSGAEKMKMALDFANGMAAQYKLKAKATMKLQELIESALAKEEPAPKTEG